MTIPRRDRIDLFTPAERAIWDATQAVEQAGCDVRLTAAVNLLHEARAHRSPSPPEVLAAWCT